VKLVGNLGRKKVELKERKLVGQLDNSTVV
jgi:hypothetical protein